MTQPKSTSERLDVLESKQAEVLTRLSAIDTRLAQLVTPGTILDATARLASLEGRVTTMENLLNQRIPVFEQVGSRVTELSSAFQNANVRLTSLEEEVTQLSTSEPPPNEQRLSKQEAALAALTERVSLLAATRGRTGLSGRLQSIEEKLNQLLPPPPPGGSQ